MPPACRNVFSIGGCHYKTACVNIFKSPANFQIFQLDPIFILYLIYTYNIHIYTHNIENTKAYRSCQPLQHAIYLYIYIPLLYT